MEAQIEKEEHHEAVGSNNSSQLVTPKFSPVSMSNVNSTESLENLHSCRAQVCDRCRKLKKKVLWYRTIMYKLSGNKQPLFGYNYFETEKKAKAN